jgi:N5-(carboxyethyl)ornithine synthase
VREEVLDCHDVKIRAGNENEARMMVEEHDGTARPLTELINEADIMVNGTFQDTQSHTDVVLEAQASSINAAVIQNDLILLFKNHEPDYPHFFIKRIEYAAKSCVRAIY